MNTNYIKKYFAILDIDFNVSEEEIKKAYRDLIQIWHPDRFSHNARLQNKAELKTKEINEAYQKIIEYFHNHSNYVEEEKPDISSEKETKNSNVGAKNESDIGPFSSMLIGMGVGGGIIISVFGLSPTPSGILGALLGLLIWSLINNLKTHKR